jgi:N-acetylglucosaminyl-diphospho-decaprenol L-rhamnosyltransferase
MWERGVDVVVPIHGGRQLTERCLAALEAQTLGHRVIVVDNASPDDSVAAIRAHFPYVDVLALGSNRGYAAACNAGIDHGVNEAIVLLNNDVIIPPRFLERLLAPLDADTHIGSVASLLLQPGERVIDSAGLSADPTLAGFPRLQGRPERSATTRHPMLLGPTGAAGAYRRAALAQVGGLDERIFLYQEDLDLALRLCAAGWSSVLAHDARALHLGSATAGRRSALQRRYAAAARGYLLRRYGVLHGRWAPRAMATEAIVVVGDALLSHDLAALRGRLAGWRSARRIVQRRPPGDGVDQTIGFLRSLRLRQADLASDDRDDLNASTTISVQRIRPTESRDISADRAMSEL